MHGDMVAVGTRDATVMLLSYATGAIMRTFGSDGTGCVTHAGVESSQLLSFHQHASLWPTALQALRAAASSSSVTQTPVRTPSSTCTCHCNVTALMRRAQAQAQYLQSSKHGLAHTRMGASRSLHSQSAHTKNLPPKFSHA